MCVCVCVCVCVCGGGGGGGWKGDFSVRFVCVVLIGMYVGKGL